MKKIIVILLLLILGFIVFGFYKDWERFQSPNYSYSTDAAIDQNYHDQAVVWNYQDAIQDLNTFVKLQWTSNEIDVRAPKEDDLETQNAVKEYSKKLAKVSYFEQKLVMSQNAKSEGWSNDQIKDFENGHSSPAQAKFMQNKILLLDLYHEQIENSKTLGVKSSLIYEVQKLLISKGYAIPLDGVFAQITSTAVADFEAKNNLYPDGKIDALTFDALIK